MSLFKPLFSRLIPSKPESQTPKERESLSFVTVLLLIMLDLFVAITLVRGLQNQTAMLTDPELKYPRKCRELLRDLPRLSDPRYYSRFLDGKMTPSIDRYYRKQMKRARSEFVDPRCREILKLAESIARTPQRRGFENDYRKLLSDKRGVQNEIAQLEQRYNTILFEKIADQPPSKSIRPHREINAENVREKYESLKRELSQITLKEEALKKSFCDHKEVRRLIMLAKSESDSILKAYERDARWLQIKKDAIQLLLLLPVVILFYLLLRRAIAKKSEIRYLIFKNLYLTVLIILLSLLSHILYVLIPKSFIASVIAFFAKLKLPILAYYLLIGLGVLLFGWVIIRCYQRKSVTDFGKSGKTLYRTSRCVHCQERVDYLRMRFCPGCGEALQRRCPHCGRWSIAFFDHCMQCGRPMSKEQVP